MLNDTIQQQTPELSEKEQTEREHNGRDPYDTLVIGAGICGIIFLKYAREMGLRCVALEKQKDVGGLWNRLPTWQDLQNRRQDIALNGVPLNGVDQPAVQRYVQEWVNRYELDPYIRLGCKVTGVEWSNGAWTVYTKHEETYRANNLIVASGVQNEPWIPDFDRSGSDIRETHSYDLQKPENLAGECVTVIGGGASSQDLLELALENGAKDIHWVYRKKVKWFLPTRRAKQKAWPNLRELGLGQSLHGTEMATTLMRWLLKYRYNHYGIDDLIPDEPFNFDRHQLIPGRASLLRNMDAVTRHKSEIQAMEGRELTLANGDTIKTDRVLWATGYRMNLRYLNLPEYLEIHRLPELFPKLGSLVRSLDYPNMFFVGMTLINSTSSTPFLAAVEARTIVSHIQEKCEIPEKILPHHLTYWDLIRYYATFDRASYPGWWKLKYFWLSLWYAAFQNRSMRV